MFLYGFLCSHHCHCRRIPSHRWTPFGIVNFWIPSLSQEASLLIPLLSLARYVLRSIQALVLARFPCLLFQVLSPDQWAIHYLTTRGQRLTSTICLTTQLLHRAGLAKESGGIHNNAHRNFLVECLFY